MAYAGHVGRRTDERLAVKIMIEMGVRPISPWPGGQKLPWPSECLTCGEREKCKPHFTSVKARWLAWQAGERKMVACNACAQRATAEHQRQAGFISTVRSLSQFSWELLTPLSEYVNQKTLVSVRCVKCMTPRRGKPDILKHTKCQCSKLARQPLEQFRPDLWNELHPRRNKDINIAKIGTGTTDKVWWLCPRGQDFPHEYRLSPASRVAPLHRGCPYCNGKRAIPGLTDFLSWAKSAMPDKNFLKEFAEDQGTIPSPNDGLPEFIQLDRLLPWSNIKVKWVCPESNCGFNYLASPAERSAGQDCPACAGKQVNVGVNDLASQSPIVAAEWHPSRNGDSSPEDFLKGSSKKVWWLCSEGHEWDASINSRTGQMKRGCPSCAESGYRPERPGILYFIQNEELGSRKFGITNSDAKKLRLKRFETMGWEQVLVLENANGYLAKEAERKVRHWIRKELKLPKYLRKHDLPLTEGWTETFPLNDGPTNFEVMDRYRKIWAEVAQSMSSGTKVETKSHDHN